MKITGLLTTFFLLTVLTQARCFAFTIEYPPDKAIVSKKVISIIISQKRGELDTIRVFDKSRKPSEVSSTANATNRCVQVALEYGLNNLEIQGLHNGSIIGRQSIQVYLQGRLRSASQKPPAMFTPYIFHSPVNEQKCTACHSLDPTIKDLTPQPPETSSCHTCHAPLDANVFIHHPSRQWYCLFCHQPLDPQEKYRLTGEEKDYCFICHSSQVRNWQKQPVIHGPVGMGQCSLCHDPHSSGQRALLRMQTTDLCLKCHEDKATGAHVIAGFYGKGHPVRGVRNPLQPDREFTCAGCHDPHAGKNRNLLRHDGENMTDYCTLCHKL